ncbi:hypothetical protein [Rhodopirellula sp. SWK7]|uniref:hypothetical protein n=1 Tax=Rhodopirellula sp. SWK7 TaxID=595460 RepID=UPI0002BFB8F8|nr:hypothetical protein [Rhodopirellula sp. SWK7]EMI45405.1 hypothetical protein RRSWK_01809 [Rhodopirellula sp. SWK7]
MAKSEQQRQKKLARKKAKDRQKKQQLVREKQRLASLSGKMSAAAAGKVLKSMVGNADQGLATVMIARQAPEGQVAVGVFLVDIFCLGVKNAVGVYYSPGQFSEMSSSLIEKHSLEDVSPGRARGVVEASVEYARTSGLSPHPDYRKVQLIWGDIEPESVEGVYEFGHEGKPFYMVGPYDDAATQGMVLSKLESTLGVGNFDFMIGGFAGSDAAFEEFGALEHFDDEPEIGDDEAAGAIVDGAVETRRIDSAD